MNTSKNTEVDCTYVIISIVSIQGTALLPLSTAGVVGMVITQLVVIATCYACGLLTGLIVRRRKHVPSASGDLSAPTYEQVLPPTQTSISLKENAAYGQFKTAH
jgi:hypothetical protein